jgi:hypothetical protein
MEEKNSAYMALVVSLKKINLFGRSRCRVEDDDIRVFKKDSWVEWTGFMWL